jgi:hypothetical protein
MITVTNSLCCRVCTDIYTTLTQMVQMEPDAEEPPITMLDLLTSTILAKKCFQRRLNYTPFSQFFQSPLCVWNLSTDSTILHTHLVLLMFSLLLSLRLLLILLIMAREDQQRPQVPQPDKFQIIVQRRRPLHQHLLQPLSMFHQIHRQTTLHRILPQMSLLPLNPPR